MKIDELPLDPNIINFLKSQGYTELYPPQEDAIKAGVLDGKNILVSAPTASGKTLIAILAIIQHIKKHKTKIVYLSPLKALAAEKFSEFKKLETAKLDRKIKVTISTGDFDSDDTLKNSDILILTNEKMDSLMRFSPSWIDDIGLVISDEIHLVGDEGRGPTLEMILTRFKLGLAGNKSHIIALSATITNYDELAEWLECKPVESKWRPVPLSEAVYDDFTVKNQERESYKINFDSVGLPSIGLGIDSVKNGGQSLLFAMTRPSSVKLAMDSGKYIEKKLGSKELAELGKISKKILSNNEQTELIKKLASVVKQGVAFHHAGLNQNCREIIETEFRNGKIKLLSATPTLAAGVNLPARRVVISSILRYNSKFGGNSPISVLEYKQLCGRAGRPQYDKEGESIIIAKQIPQDDLLEHYVDGEPEPIESKITEPSSLRIHLLSLVVTSPTITEDRIYKFFSQTLGGMQVEDETIELNLENAKSFLQDEKFIVNKEGGYIATKFGQMVSRLYIDPMTARDFRNAIEYDVSKGRKHTFGFLHLITNCNEFFPKFELRNKDEERADVVIENNKQTKIKHIEMQDCTRSLLAMDLWINEGTEIDLSDQLNIESGDIYRMVETANWLVYSLRELSRLLGRADLISELDALRQRIRYGIKEELIDLVKIKGIGRVRARRLYKNNIKTRQDLATTSVNQLAAIDKIGMTVANSIKSQLRVR
jgi:helicase